MLLMIQILYYILFPFLALELARRFKFFDLIGPVVLCYLGGLILAALWPAGGDGAAYTQISQTVSEAAVPLAIPLLVFSADIVSWLRFARTTVFSFGLAILSVLVTGTAAFFFFGTDLPDGDGASISGMLVGVYTGGTPNLAAIGKGLGVHANKIAVVNAADFFIGAIYFLFLITLARPLLGLILRPFPGKTDADLEAAAAGAHQGEGPGADSGPFAFFTSGRMRGMSFGFLLSVLILLLSAGLSFLITGIQIYFQPERENDIARISVPIIMLGLTVPALLFSLNARVRAWQGTYELGEYFINVFCVCIGSQISAELITQGQSYLLYCAFVMVGSILLHYGLAALFRIDRDTAIITSTAAIYGPPFVGPIAETLKNRQVVISGLTTGLVGFAIGNYLGFGLAYILENLF